jgi:hypothetical protein
MSCPIFRIHAQLNGEEIDAARYRVSAIVGHVVIMSAVPIRKEGAALFRPTRYYDRFGFKPTKMLKLEGMPTEYFLVLSIDGIMPSGNVEYHIAFAEND